MTKATVTIEKVKNRKGGNVLLECRYVNESKNLDYNFSEIFDNRDTIKEIRIAIRNRRENVGDIVYDVK